jgi:hypothetical protein
MLEGLRYKSIKDPRSVLLGPKSGRRSGPSTINHAPALAERFSSTPLDRLTAGMASSWFGERFPPSSSANHAKKGMSLIRGFLGYAVSQAWTDASILEACRRMPSGAPRDLWLRPAQVLALEELIDRGETLDDYQRFAWNHAPRRQDHHHQRPDHARAGKALTPKCDSTGATPNYLGQAHGHPS